MAVTRVADQLYITNSTYKVRTVTSAWVDTTGFSQVIITGNVLYVAGTGSPTLKVGIEGSNDGFNPHEVFTLTSVSFAIGTFAVPSAATAIDGFAFVRALFEVTEATNQDIEVILTADLALTV